MCKHKPNFFVFLIKSVFPRKEIFNVTFTCKKCSKSIKVHKKHKILTRIFTVVDNLIVLGIAFLLTEVNTFFHRKYMIQMFVLFIIIDAISLLLINLIEYAVIRFERITTDDAPIK